MRGTAELSAGGGLELFSLTRASSVLRVKGGELIAIRQDDIVPNRK